MYFLKIYSITISGDFATFRKPDTNSVYLTYNNPPVSSLLGLFGAILGHTGYIAKKKDDLSLPEFYTILSNLWLSLSPDFDSKSVFLKQMVTYNNLQGYGSNDGNLIITEQILISPKWKIYLFDEHNKYAQLIDRLNKNETVFTPYLGKNEFRAQISDYNEFSITKEYSQGELSDIKSLKYDSLVLLKDLNQKSTPYKKSLSKGISLSNYLENTSEDSSFMNEDGYAIFENYPYALGTDLHYKTCLSAFSNWDLDTSLIRNGTRTFKLSDGKVIQMFNGGVE